MSAKNHADTPSAPRQSRWPLLALLASLSLLSLCALDAHLRGVSSDVHAARHAELSALLGTPDLALSSSSRWLRHPTQVEAGAAAADAPAALDVDPAGSWIGPPRQLLGQSARNLRRVPAPPAQRQVP